MKIAVIGDIHSNHTALEKCLSWIYENEVDGIVFLGDYVTDCPYPMKTIDILKNISKTYKTWFIRGNRENYIIDYHRNREGWSYGSKTGSLLYTYESLTLEAVQWLMEMPEEIRISVEGCGTITACHCPPYYQYRQKEPSDEKIRETAENMDTDVLLCAHSHIPLVKNCGEKLIVNSGSVGVAIDGITDAQFTVLEFTDKWSAKIISLEYDIEAAAAEFTESGIIEKGRVWSIGVREMLKTGVEYTVDCIDEIRNMLAINPDKTEFDEELWELAAKKTGLDISEIL